MIVLDENLMGLRLDRPIARWYPGKVLYLPELRPGTTIKDEEIPALLRQVKGATFVTTNAADFWRRIPAHRRYCVICFPLPNERLEEVPGLLRRLLRLKEFRTKAARLGKVIRASAEEIRYYQAGDPTVHALPWPQSTT